MNEIQQVQALEVLRALNEAEQATRIIDRYFPVEPPRQAVVDLELLESAAGVLQELQAAMGSDSISRKAMDILTTDAQVTYEAIDGILQDPTTPETASTPADDDGWELIDTLHGHVRHKARIARDGTAQTQCAKSIIHYFRVRRIGEGLLNAKPCKGCLP